MDTMNLQSLNYDISLLPQYLLQLRSKLRIAVVYGGDKQQPGAVIYRAHNSRSWKSYEIVARDIQLALQELGFANVITLPDDMRLPQRLTHEKIHLVWLNTGGVQGYNPVSHAPAMLEMLGIPYVGHNPLNAALLDNKDVFKGALQSLSIATCPFLTWHSSEGILDPHTNPTFVRAFGDYSGPFVVKPVSGRASLHVNVVDSKDEVPVVAREVYDVTHNNVLIEKYVSGREFCVAVCGPVVCEGGALVQHTAPFAFSAIERTLEPGEKIFTSMDKKAITTDRFRVIDDTEPDLKKALFELAQKIYIKCGLRSLVRIDVRADADGRLYVLEANPKPDLKKPSESSTSLVMAGFNTSYNDLIFGLLADRMHTLFSYDRDNARHIVDLLMNVEKSRTLNLQSVKSEIKSYIMPSTKYSKSELSAKRYMQSILALILSLVVLGCVGVGEMYPRSLRDTSFFGTS